MDAETNGIADFYGLHVQGLQINSWNSVCRLRDCLSDIEGKNNSLEPTL